MPSMFAVSYIRHLTRRGYSVERIKAGLERYHPYEVITDAIIDMVIWTDPSNQTAPGHRGAKAGPADGLPSLPAGPDIRRKT